MNRLILIDGNNLLFRSYYATAYNGNFMKNSKGFPTNGLFGFTNMINKIILEEKPQYIIVAFDKGRTFRNDKFPAYKEGRIETPHELKQQFPIAKELLTAMGIKYYEIANYEADDIIGTFAKFCDADPEFVGTIVSSDKDLLQLISADVEIKLLKQKDYLRYNLQGFIDEYQFTPDHIVDLKALQGDPSDNIPGVKGIGEKTALKLIQEYQTLDNLYANIDSIGGKLQEKLIADKEMAYLSYELATIIKDVPVEINMNDVIYKEKDHVKLNALYEDLEFYSFIKKENNKRVEKPIDIKIITDIKDLKVTGECAIYLEILGTNYHNSKVLGMSIYNPDVSYFIPANLLAQCSDFLINHVKYTYDMKKVYVALKWLNIPVSNIKFDTMLAAYLLDYNIKDDIAYLANAFGADMAFYENIYGKSNKLIEPSEDIIAYNSVMKAKFIYDSYMVLKDKLISEEQLTLLEEIEMPTALTLGDMEYAGVNVDRLTLIEMGQELNIKIELVTKDIYNYAGEEFNISSPKVLGEILFTKLHLPHSKKSEHGFSTAIDVLNKLNGTHPIIEHIIEYRMLTKLNTTYINGLLESVMPDGKIHTIYQQALTRTGRLSSIEPNLQNIPIRSEYGRMIRKAFIPSKDCLILSADYSQIELRILAHMSNVQALIDAFKQDLDIHTKTAMDIFHVEKSELTKNMRRIAKAVNFGIIYGISSFGLSGNLDISMSEAKTFIDNYLHTYPGVKEFMDKTIKQAYQDGYVKTLLNRKRNLPELKNTNYMIRGQGERMALNTPIQGTSADIIKKAMVSINQIFKDKKLKSQMILQVHDELVFDCLESEKDAVIAIVTDVMENNYKLNVPLKVDIEYGNNWYQAK